MWSYDVYELLNRVGFQLEWRVEGRALGLRIQYDQRSEWNVWQAVLFWVTASGHRRGGVIEACFVLGLEFRNGLFF